jgi:hypothetical protein
MATPALREVCLFGHLRGPEGERLVLVENVFIEKVLQTGTQRVLTDEERDTNRMPYRHPRRVPAALAGVATGDPHR